MAKKKYQKIVDDITLYKDAFDNPKGQKLLVDLCRRVQYFQPSYRGENHTHKTIFRDGQKNVINMILSIIQQDPSKLLQNFRESEKQELQYD